MFGRIARNLGRAVKQDVANAKSFVGKVLNVLGDIFGRKARKIEPPETGQIPTTFIIREQPQEPPLEFGSADVFLFFETPHVGFDSSNVVSFQYFNQEHRLIVGYKGRRPPSEVGYYEYLGVTEDEAKQAFMAMSKGGWVWDVLRVRGTRCGHKKPYQFLPKNSLWSPKRGCQ